MNNPFVPATPVAKKLKVLIYGPSGSGKTRAALSFPGVALVDAEGGADLYAGRPGVTPFAILRAKNLSDLEKAIAFIQEDDGKTYQTLVIDPITVFYDVQKEATARGAKDNQLSPREWGKINNRMKAVYNSLTNLPVHVVALAREAVEYEGEGLALRKVGVKPDADKALIYIMDFAIHMNADHSGSVTKSRGMVLGENGTLKAVNWAAFEPASLAYTYGQKVEQEDEDEAARREAERERMVELANAVVTDWKRKGLTADQITAALNIKKLGEWDWSNGRESADETIQTWVDADAKTTPPAQPKSNGSKIMTFTPPAIPVEDKRQVTNDVTPPDVSDEIKAKLPATYPPVTPAKPEPASDPDASDSKGDEPKADPKGYLLNTVAKRGDYTSWAFRESKMGLKPSDLALAFGVDPLDLNDELEKYTRSAAETRATEWNTNRNQEANKLAAAQQ